MCLLDDWPYAGIGRVELYRSERQLVYCVGSVWPPNLTRIGLSRQVPRCAVQSRDTSVRDTKSKGRIVLAMHCPKRLFPKGRNIGDVSFWGHKGQGHGVHIGLSIRGVLLYGFSIRRTCDLYLNDDALFYLKFHMAYCDQLDLTRMLNINILMYNYIKTVTYHRRNTILSHKEKLMHTLRFVNARKNRMIYC
jgi:hypothetical protein